MTDIVDREQRERLKVIKAAIHKVDRDAARALWEWGTLFREVEEKELWRADGHPTFTSWVEEEMGHSLRSARRAMEVSRHFTLEMCDRWGSTKLGMALRYAEITQKEELPGDLTALRIRYREPNGDYASKSFAEASANDIRAVCAQLLHDAATKKRKATARAIDGSFRERGIQMQKAMPPAPKGTSRGDRVVFQKGKDGELAVSFKAVPVKQLQEFVASLTEHMLDTGVDDGD